jgi:hypothetical protein
MKGKFLNVCREVVALEERLLHLLHRVPQGDCNWSVKSRDPRKFMMLDDSLLEEIACKPSLSTEVSMFEGMTGGWRAVGSPWIVPESLLASRTVSCVQKQVKLPQNLYTSTDAKQFEHALTLLGTDQIFCST